MTEANQSLEDHILWENEKRLHGGGDVPRTLKEHLNFRDNNELIEQEGRMAKGTLGNGTGNHWRTVRNLCYM